ncbi:AAA family ATPase [candidate division KSB1 bacterium]|nr:AAA family ATPase [candidate division KSB1 bacterium]
MFKTIIINGLFKQFNYKIELKDEGITILTGPNGYGKTTILKIIYAFAVKNLAFFFQLPFNEIVFIQENIEMRLLKTAHATLEIQVGNKKTISYKKSDFLTEIKRWFENSPYRQVDENRWLDRRTETFYTTEYLFNQLIENDPDIQIKINRKPMPDIGTAYLIREQRLLRKTTRIRRRAQWDLFEAEMRENFNNTIEEYTSELSRNLKEILAQASRIGQELDSSFPRRLFDEASSISEEEFNQRYDLIKQKQSALSKFGLSTIKEDRHTSFKIENSKALLVYLNDTEKKLAVFDDVLQKLEIFSTILNERRFAFKQLEISPENGFRFKSGDGNELSLTSLSSGEQQEVVLLYELLFKVKSNTLVLIDEPEISLHVAWQKDFLNDLLKIIKLQKIDVITATHSPQIIDTHWDFVVDLEEISRCVCNHF